MGGTYTGRLRVMAMGIITQMAICQRIWSALYLYILILQYKVRNSFIKWQKIGWEFRNWPLDVSKRAQFGEAHHCPLQSISRNSMVALMDHIGHHYLLTVKDSLWASIYNTLTRGTQRNRHTPQGTFIRQNLFRLFWNNGYRSTYVSYSGTSVHLHLWYIFCVNIWLYKHFPLQDCLKKKDCEWCLTWLCMREQAWRTGLRKMSCKKRDMTSC